MLTMPILDSKGRALAVMQFLNKNGGVFSREDFDMLHALCAQTSMAIQVSDSVKSKNRVMNQEERQRQSQSEMRDSLLNVPIKQISSLRENHCNASFRFNP
jgi:hypothetical protein